MASELKKAGSNFINEQGKIDTEKLIAANPALLADVMHRAKDAAEGGATSFDNQAMTVATVSASISEAGGGKAYAPLQAQKAVQELAQVAAYTLGLTNDLGIAPGSNPFPDHGVNPNYVRKDKGAGNPNEGTENNN